MKTALIFCVMIFFFTVSVVYIQMNSNLLAQSPSRLQSSSAPSTDFDDSDQSTNRIQAIFELSEKAVSVSRESPTSSNVLDRLAKK